MAEIYLDNSATTGLCCSSVRAMEDVISGNYGNPSSLHDIGLKAEKTVSLAREQVLTALGARDRNARLIFCASGTEADNLALRGVAYSKEKFRGGRIIITDSEHPAVDECAASLEAEGFEVVRIPTRGGVLDSAAATEAINGRTFLISLMTVNNETGALYDIASVFRAAKAKNPDIVTHTDAVQAFLKIPMSPERLCADLVTLSGHKIHGPKGVGALYISGEVIKRKNIRPVIFGGGQEWGYRSGTENTVGIAGFGAAAEEGAAALRENHRILCALREHFLSSLPDRIKVKEPAGAYAPHIINITLPDIKSETMLHYLSAKGIYVSSGSACSSHGHGGNRVLTAYGASEREADCSLRVSLCAQNTKEELSAAARALEDGINELITIK